MEDRMKRLFRSAYTLVEVVIVLVIIGVVSIISMYSIKNSQNQYKKLYYVAYDTLVQTVGNAYLSWAPISGKCSALNDDVTELYWSEDCWAEYTKTRTVQGSEVNGGAYYTSTYEAEAIGGIKGYPRQYPGFLFGDPTVGEFDGSGTDKAFCKLLTEQINTIDETNECKSFISGVRPKEDLSVGSDFLSTFCALMQKYNENGEVQKDSSGNVIGECSGTGNIIPSFVAANGQKFYISTVLTANPPYIDGTGKEYERMQFRLVAVDLNGDSGPNTQLRSGMRMPDIVLFAIKNDGVVIPLGRPEFDELYASAMVYYPKYLNKPDPNNPNTYKKNDVQNSDLMTLFNAKLHAWAGQTVQGGAQNYFGQQLVLSEPLSFTNLLYFWAVNCKVEGCNAKTVGISSSVPFYVDSLFANLVMQFIFDKKNSAEDIVPREITQGILDEDYGCTLGESKCKVEIAH